MIWVDLWYLLEPLVASLPPQYVEVSVPNVWTAIGVIGLLRVEMHLAARHH